MRWGATSLGTPGLALVVACLLAASGITATASSHRGRSLFRGQEALKGRVRGHSSDLPPETVRCRNCHVVGTQPQPAERALGPRLDRTLLLEPRPRRGGPPSSYAGATFCELLRTGADPAHVVIAREMPVYDVDDAQCLSLWQFLTER
jgi:hypothetical protein